jgi:hypothetical protein
MRRVLAAAGVLVVAAVTVVWLMPSPATNAIAVPTPSPQPRAQAPEADPPSSRRPIPMPLAPSTAGRDDLPPRVEPLRLERDPRSPDYDAAKLYGAGERNVLDFFAAEPRDPTWAPERERDLMDIVPPRMKEVDQDAKIEVECHTATCRVRVHSRDKALTQRLDSYPLTCLANTAVPMWGDPEDAGSGSGSNADLYSDFYLIFGRSTRDRAGMMERNRPDGLCAKYREAFFRHLAKQ